MSFLPTHYHLWSTSWLLGHPSRVSRERFQHGAFPFLPLRASSIPSASIPQCKVRITHLALSLKEMREIPGGAFRTFWEPEYKMSMPRTGMENGMSEIPQRNPPDRCVRPIYTVSTSHRYVETRRGIGKSWFWISEFFCHTYDFRLGPLSVAFLLLSAPTVDGGPPK